MNQYQNDKYTDVPDGAKCLNICSIENRDDFCDFEKKIGVKL